MIDIETASRSIDIVVGVALLAMIASAVLAWIWCSAECKEQKRKARRAVDRAVREARAECREELVQHGAGQFSEIQRLKRIVEEQNSELVRLTGENQRMASIIERASK